MLCIMIYVMYTYVHIHIHVYMYICCVMVLQCRRSGTGAVTEEMTLLVFVNVHGEAPYLPGFQAFYHLNKKEYIYMGWTGIRE
jgi:hypothetical protein